MNEKPSFSLDDLEKLSRIRLSTEEKMQFPSDIEKILTAGASLEEVDTNDIPPCNCVSAFSKNVLREDVIEEKDTFANDFLANAPSLVGRMIKTPPVIK
jgi:aspartyl-tRNA(Asn)/glutamyl-tRNA(Gln) amidotransferase subunit C